METFGAVPSSCDRIGEAARCIEVDMRQVYVPPSGALLVAFGVLLATGELVRLTAVLSRFTGLTVW
jgi:hypothetical protein